MSWAPVKMGVITGFGTKNLQYLVVVSYYTQVGPYVQAQITAVLII